MLSAAIAWALGIATLLGGIAAIGYFRDKWNDRLQWPEQEKIVSSIWWESSLLKSKYQETGCAHFAWSNRDRLAERIAEGMEVVLETDAANRIKYRLVNRSGQVLICRRSA